MNNQLVSLLYGPQDCHIQQIERYFDVTISTQGNHVFIEGAAEAVAHTKSALTYLFHQLNQGHFISTAEVEATLIMIHQHSTATPEISAFSSNFITLTTERKAITARTQGQSDYLQQLLNKDLVFGIGPAGCGKTYLAVATAVSMLCKNQVKRLILSRPAVEAGEKLGFLPGAIRDKIDPYLRPLYDALYDMMPAEVLKKRLESEEIEIAPLAFMRGRTLSDAYVILDEAQNTTEAQMKMFLTRLGKNSRMVITGDISQIDLPQGCRSGLIQATQVLRGVKKIGWSRLTENDIIRHSLVSDIVQAYQQAESVKC